MPTTFDEPGPLTILVIEDDIDIAELVYQVLNQEGYRVLRAKSGEAGLALMDQERADLVLLDVMLPGIDGFEVCRRLKARWTGDGESVFLPVVMLTAKNSHKDVLVALEAGADDYLHKPFELDELLLRVRAMLRIVRNEHALARRNRELEAAYSQEKQTRRQLEALETVTAVGLSELSLESLLQRLIEQMAHVSGADAGGIFLVNPETQRLEPRATYGLANQIGPPKRHNAVWVFVQSIAAQGQTTQRVLKDMPQQDETHIADRVIMGAPLMVRGRRIGVATLGRIGAAPFATDEFHLFEVMAHRAALAIENSALLARSERDLEMKTLLLRELQHRVRNNLQAISGILQFQMSRETTGQAAILGAMRRIKSIAATQDFLFKREGGPIPVPALLEVVAQQLVTLWALPDQTVQVVSSQPTIELSMERAQIVGLVIHELIANAFQHGLADRPGVIRLSIVSEPEEVRFEVVDPGPGFPPSFDLQSQHLAGLKLVQILLQREFRVNLWIESQPGWTRVGFSIPGSFFQDLHRQYPETRSNHTIDRG